MSLVIPPALLYMLTSGGFRSKNAAFSLEKDDVALRVIYKDGRIFLRNRSIEVTYMKNRFDLIEPVGAPWNVIPPYARLANDNTFITLEDPNGA